MTFPRHDGNPHQILMARNYMKHLNYNLRSQTDHLIDYQPQQPLFPNRNSAFPVLAVALLSIIVTAFLLASYYIFVVKLCCSNWHQLINPFRRLSISGWSAQDDDESFIALSPAMWTHGLDDSAIREIPSFQFSGRDIEERIACVVCLSEFRVHDTLRALPNCNHAFHLDCIDIWLQSNANCPLCRTIIAGAVRCPLDRVVAAPSSSPREFQAYSDMGSDEDFVVIELGGEEEMVGTAQIGQEERNELSVSPRKAEKKVLKKCHHGSIVGDEWIDVRDLGTEDRFCVQPIRRSFSWDSAIDSQLYTTVHEILLQKNTSGLDEVSTSAVHDRRIWKSFISFRQGKGSRNAVFPYEL